MTTGRPDPSADGGATAAALLSVRDLDVLFRRGRTTFHAVRGVDLDVRRGEIVGIVGESGAGKSTLGRAILGLVPVSAGTIALDGEDITQVRRTRRVELAGRLQAVFQDPYSSLNPARTVGSALAEPLGVQRVPAAEMRPRVTAMLERVGLSADAAGRYPRSFSGGQRQRISIARALICDPDLVICDEALSALDLSVQAQIVNLLLDLRDERGFAYLFIGHDLAIIRHLADRVVVLRRGEIVESGVTAEVCGAPTDPYTRALMDAAPVPDPARERARLMERVSGLARAPAAAP